MFCDTKVNNKAIDYRVSLRPHMAAKKTVRRTPLTEEQQLDCRLLREKWDELKRAGRPLSQKQLATIYSVDPSTVSQILRSHIALNTEWKLNFAQYMDLLPQQIWPAWAYTRVTAGRMPEGIEPIVEEWPDMTDEKKLALVTLVRPGGNPRRSS